MRAFDEISHLPDLVLFTLAFFALGQLVSQSL